MKNFEPISSHVLIEKFGTSGLIYSNVKERLVALWEKANEEICVKTIFNNWSAAIASFYGEQPDFYLFIDHTYLIILAKILVYLKLSNKKPDETEVIKDVGYTSNVLKVVNGKYFLEKGITNFLEKDFSAWLNEPKVVDKSVSIYSDFMGLLTDYDFSNISEDLFREIYEEIIAPRERHKVGEYYTPEWLVQTILNEVFKIWKNKKSHAIPKIIDPACGSGTFLYHVIKYLSKKRKTINLTLSKVLTHVVGFDINPITTIIAKANYLLAICDFIEDSDKINLPIYTKDCLISPDLFDYDTKIDKFDIIIGNPPWVVMRSMKSREYQNFLKNEVLKYNLLESKNVHLFTQLELATLFFNKCADLYLRSDGIIAFVMPRSVIAGTIHHINFRRFRNPPLGLKKIIDLENVSPLFNMPSCVLIALKGGLTKYPVLCEKYIGELPNRNSSLLEAKSKLTKQMGNYVSPDLSATPCYYYDKFKVGASLFPRTLYFVDLMCCDSPPENINNNSSNQIAVKTSDEILNIVKDPWKVTFEFNIEVEFLFATLLAWEIFPFGYVRLRPVVLPIKGYFNGYRLLDLKELDRNGLKGMTEWLKKAQTIWDIRRTPKSEKRFPSILDRLNYHNLLTSQNLTKRYVVLYNATGTNLVSCVIEKHFLPNFQVNQVNGIELKPKGFIADVKTWYFETNDEMEAHYLCAIFNSAIISKLIKPLQPKGLFGARAIHRRPLLFPIPKYDENEGLHVELANCSKFYHRKIKSLKIVQESNVRAQIRKILEEEIRGLNKLVSSLLNTSYDSVEMV